MKGRMLRAIGLAAIGIALAGLNGAGAVRVASPSAGRDLAPARLERSQSQAPSRSTAASSAQGAAAQQALVNRYCVGCHNSRTRTGGLALDGMDFSRVAADADVWEKVVKKVRGNLMPPPRTPRPDPAAYDAFAAWLEGELDRTADANPNPGRTETFHRLNRAEYQNAIRDLLALDVDVVALLPADDASYGFDNMAGTLKLDQSRLERYLAAATRVSRMAVGWPAPEPTSAEFRASSEASQYEHIDGLPFGTRGGMLVRYNFPQDGEYQIRVELLCRLQGGDCDGAAGFADEHQLDILIDGERVGHFVLEPHDQPDDPLPLYQARVRVTAGPHTIGATFLALPDIEEVESRRERFQRPFFLIGNVFEQSQVVWQPYVDKLSVTGPFSAAGPGDTPSRRRIFVCRPTVLGDETSCAKRILSRLAEHAYRRPVTDADVERLLTFFASGRAEGSFDAGIVAAIERLLVSPEFLFRIARDPAGAAPLSTYRISDLEMASRLSFFLWSSLPDKPLIDLARDGRLRRPEVLEREVRRMLQDPRADALVRNFVGQWLQLRNLDVVAPSVPLFPDFDDSLRQAFRRETELFFGSVLREDRSAIELLNADYTFLNERLARHYGIPDVVGSQFRRVSLAGRPRRGLLGQGSVLTVTSRPNRTSPVLRGKWVLEAILATPPPPPPPAVPPLPEPSQSGRQATLPMREQMAQHRANPACAACHSVIDPLGFALENFDATGRWRDVDSGFARIDASGNLPDGTAFDGLASFQAGLLKRPERFAGALTEKLLTYALGRGLEAYDMPAVRRVVRESTAKDFRLSSLVLGVARSVPFQYRRAAAPAAESTTGAAQ